MTRAEAIHQLEELVEDRKSFITGEEDHDAEFQKDIEALRFALHALKSEGTSRKSVGGTSSSVNIDGTEKRRCLSEGVYIR